MQTNPTNESSGDEHADRGADVPLGAAPTITAMLADGPLEGMTIEVEVVEGRPPKIIDVPDEGANALRYCLAEWVQAGQSAAYTFLYRVD